MELEAEKLFADAAAEISRTGHTPLNPLEMVDQTPGRTYNEYLADALAILLKQADAVLFLRNYHNSVGAMIERHIAMSLEIDRYWSLDEVPIGSDWPEEVER